jgi:galactofuranosylgalactofuranosylrhamnosyl-N-acetylglucosaminyl-diphospho-decaprenol beta-1,5/1,6-galactofuranosyltransferase
MNIIGNLKLPKSVDIADLYFRTEGQYSGLTDENDPEDLVLESSSESTTQPPQFQPHRVFLKKGDILSSSTYFNSFYERFYTEYTSIDAISYCLKLEGDFKVTVYREFAQGNPKETVLEELFENCQLSTPVQLPTINLIQGGNAGRLYLEIDCLSEQGIFEGGWIATEQSKKQEVSLAIVICTYKKEEFVRNTLATLLQDKYLENKKFKVFISDNGKTLDKTEFSDPRVKIFPNKNVGGSGGFSRGLLEAWDENSYTHYLVMDDDIELESESICKLFSLHEYAKTEFVAAGALLDLKNKHILFEAGATHDDSVSNRGKSGVLVAINNNVDLRQNETLNKLILEEEEADYGGFWFCSFSKETLEQLNLPLPLFIKIDDVEFCLRAKLQLGIPVVPFPSMAVWHLPATAKNLSWETYYYFRNDLITYAIHFTPHYEYTVSNLTQEIMNSLSRKDFDNAQMIIQAFEDYLKGPDWLTSIDTETVHPELIKQSRYYANAPDIDLLANVQLLTKWTNIVKKGGIVWADVSKDWKDASQSLMSPSLWREYLGTHEALLKAV